jgi:hypothetical protein
LDINLEKGERIAVIYALLAGWQRVHAVYAFYDTPKRKRKATDIRNIQARWRYHNCSGKAISVSHSEYVPVALVNKYALSMPSVILPSVSCLPLPYFPTLSQRARFSAKKLLNIKCVF